MKYVYPSIAEALEDTPAAVAQRAKGADHKKVRFNACVLRVELVPENRIRREDAERSRLEARKAVDYLSVSQGTQDNDKSGDDTYDTSLEVHEESSKWSYEVLPPMRLSPSASVGEQSESTDRDDRIVFVPPKSMKNISEEELLPYVKIKTKLPTHAAIKRAKSCLNLCATSMAKPEPSLGEMRTSKRAITRRRVASMTSTPLVPSMSETYTDIIAEQRMVRRAKAKFLVREEDESDSEEK